ncbi:hypothetical protein U0070_000028 [Myodes glareolus]|uniref:Uncharacterized protein n=1 Tax=Myodes glareolus TaxID=447135 RepID=A0AAW0HVE2_MYOGA
MPSRFADHFPMPMKQQVLEDNVKTDRPSTHSSQKGSRATWETCSTEESEQKSKLTTDTNLSKITEGHRGSERRMFCRDKLHTGDAQSSPKARLGQLLLNQASLQLFPEWSARVQSTLKPGHVARSSKKYCPEAQLQGRHAQMEQNSAVCLCKCSGQPVMRGSRLPSRTDSQREDPARFYLLTNRKPTCAE